MLVLSIDYPPMLSRRSFLHVSGSTAAAGLLAPYINGRGLEGGILGAEAHDAAPSIIRLDSNENPNGPGDTALRAITDSFSISNRYPGSSVAALRSAIAKSFSIQPANVVVGCGSTDILRAGVYGFCDSTHGLVACAPGFESPVEDAKRIGAPVRMIPVTGELKLDLDAMATAARGAGLVYLCNPNNPTSTVHGTDAVKSFIQRVNRESPTTTILVDEAYHEYVDDPSYATSLPVAMNNPRVFIARTFSKVFGMAGLRVGYALGDEGTIKKLANHVLDASVNVLGANAALATLGDRAHVAEEQKLNRASRAFTRKWFTDTGYRVADTQANFLMVDLRRNAQPFRDACRKNNVFVGRPFPPLDNHIRISIGTMDEMRRAVDIFRGLLPAT